MPSMKTIEDVRADRLAELVRELGGASILADKIERSPAQVSQWVNRSVDSKTGKPRRISSDMCRYIESKLKKPPGWMDREDTVPQLVAQPAANDHVLDEVIELVNLYRQSSKSGREFILDAARSAARVTGNGDDAEIPSGESRRGGSAA